jgi:hypothetical protein
METNHAESPFSFCAEPALLEVLEYCPEDRSLTLDTCCEAMNNFALSELPYLSRKELAAWFESTTGVKVRQIIMEDTPTWCVDEGLTFCPVTGRRQRASLQNTIETT